MESIETLKKKLAECKKSGKEKVKILNQLSQAYLNKSPDKSLEYGKQALELSEKVKNVKEKVKALNNIGTAYYYLSDCLKVIEYCSQALKIGKEIGDKKEVVYSLNNIGNAYDDLGNNEKALEYHINSLEIREEIEDKKGISTSLNNIGVVYIKLGNYDKASDYFLKSLKINEEIKDKKGVAISFCNIGNVYFYLKKYNKVLEYYKKSLKIHKEIKSTIDIAISSSNIGLIYKILNKYDKALDYYLEALKIYEKIGNKYGIANTSNNIGALHIEQKDYNKASQYLEQGLKSAKEIKSKDLFKASYETFSELYSIKENYKKALEYYKLYSETKDSIFTEESSNKIAEMQTKYETEKKEKEAEIYKLKNIELAEANEDIQKKNKELESYREHINLINKILRHDLMNKLVVIKTATKLFSHSGDKKYLDELNKSTQKSIELIRNMRELEMFISSHQGLNSYFLNDTFNEIFTSYPAVDFHVEGKGNVLADEAISSVFENIIQNAVTHGKANKIDINITRKENMCKISIADNGIGIPDKIKKMIFDEDFVYGKTGHTGLGLYIVKKAMENYGGSVNVEDNQPKGTVFILTFMKVG
jgi:signal transduction histidine kinase